MAAAGRPLDRQDHSDTGAFGGPFGDVGPDCLVPMLGRVGQTGLLVVGPRRSEEPYSGEDLRLLGTVAAQAGLAAESIALGERIAERVEAERFAAREIEIAREVQAQLLPQRRPPLRTLDYEGVCVQARVVGGDYYDFLDLGQQRLGLVIGDIAGKGMAAALLMANLQANLRSQCAIAVEHPEQLLRSVNRLFFENTADNAYATLFYSEFHDRTCRLRYANCGHLPGLVLRKDGSVERLKATAPVVGLFSEWECPTSDVQLSSGDLFAIYTDGITEAFNQRDEEFGEDRLIDTLQRCRDRSPNDVVTAVFDEVRQFSPDEQSDDVTLIVARCR